MSYAAWARGERSKCRAKAHYASEARARAVGYFSLRGDSRTDTLWPYHCPWCSRWHLTSTTGDKTARVRPITATASGLMG